MVFVNLTWQAASVYCAALFLSSFFLGAMIQPTLVDTKGQKLCLLCPHGVEDNEKNVFFGNGATLLYHLVCFAHFGGMAAGLFGLVLSLLVQHLNLVFAIALPLVWLLANAVHLIVLAVQFKWESFHTKDPALWEWFVITGVGAAALVALVLKIATVLL